MLPRNQFLSPLLTSGGDRRIVVEAGGTTNRYGAAPYPRATLGYSSSTANDISAAAFRHLESLITDSLPSALQDAQCYRDALAALRVRLRHWLGIDADHGVVFAPSGTDLEYVALALAAADGRPVTNIVLGEEEVGSGCVLAAGGRLFADRTAVWPRVEQGTPLAGFGRSMVTGLPVRDPDGAPLSSPAVALRACHLVRDALAAGRRPIVHVVHGSKTGLVLPDPAEVKALRCQFGDAIIMAVDACQARIEPAQVRSYLALNCVVLLTGSKFMGGPPFCGMAIVPPALRPRDVLAPGLATVFRRGEWPADWPGLDHLSDSANPGLLLRLEAALFELERFAGIALSDRNRVIAAFGTAVRDLASRLGVELVTPALEPGGLERSTLATLDLTALAGMPDHGAAIRWHRVLSARGLRLGQPVRCLRRPDGKWAGTLRVSLSMPAIVALARMDELALARHFTSDMSRIAEVLEAAQRRIA